MKHEHQLNEFVGMVTEPPGASVGLSHDHGDPENRHFLIIGMDGDLWTEQEVADTLSRQGFAMKKL